MLASWLKVDCQSFHHSVLCFAYEIRMCYLKHVVMVSSAEGLLLSMSVSGAKGWDKICKSHLEKISPPPLQSFQGCNPLRRAVVILFRSTKCNQLLGPETYDTLRMCLYQQRTKRFVSSFGVVMEKGEKILRTIWERYESLPLDQATLVVHERCIHWENQAKKAMLHSFGEFPHVVFIERCANLGCELPESVTTTLHPFLSSYSQQKVPR